MTTAEAVVKEQQAQAFAKFVHDNGLLESFKSREEMKVNMNVPKYFLKRDEHIHTIKDINDMNICVDRKEILYQRGGAWSSKKSTGFICTGLLGLTGVGTITLNRKKNWKYKYAPIDAKNRLLAIMLFISDGIRLPRHFMFGDFPLGGKTFSEILDEPWGDDFAEIFWNIRTHVTMYDNLTDEECAEVFYYMNSNEKLKDAEIRNAIFGPFRNAVLDIASEYKHLFKGMKISTIDDDDDYKFEDHVITSKLLQIERYYQNDSIFRDSMVKHKDLSILYLARTVDDVAILDKIQKKVRDKMKIIAKILKHFDTWLLNVGKKRTGKNKIPFKAEDNLFIMIYYVLTELQSRGFHIHNGHKFCNAFLDITLKLCQVSPKWKVGGGFNQKTVGFADYMCYHHQAQVNKRLEKYIPELIDLSVGDKNEFMNLRDSQRFIKDSDKDMVFGREDGKCESCGIQLTRKKDDQYHHAGENWANGAKSCPDKTMLVCEGCHLEIHRNN
jgi:hypothetical protein